MAVGNRTQQQQRLRRLVGRENQTALISNSLLDDCLDDALRVVNLRSPVIGVASFDTVIGQQAYEVALPTGGLRVRRVYYGPNATTAFCSVWPDFVRLMNEQGALYLQSPALILAMYQNRSVFDALAASGAQVQPPNLVYLIPTPGTVSPVFYTYSAVRFADVEDVDVAHETAYLEYAKHLLHSALATGAGAVTKTRTETGIEFGTRASDAHEKAAQRCYDKFLASFPPIPHFRAWA